ncbi:hypothetical protein VPH35_134341 [Triticum aestivum]|uniref:uncharacterized protein n=1 Tax=Triticum aestivum TaxID=4565 RepID=UPI001D03183E|nr:uncharacterized protein LOC123170261 [Triticum aestivum]
MRRRRTSPSGERTRATAVPSSGALRSSSDAAEVLHGKSATPCPSLSSPTPSVDTLLCCTVHWLALELTSTRRLACIPYFHLDEQTEDDIIWKHANDGIYTASTAYKAQFLGLTLSPMDRMVWKAWAPPKVNFFAWLALQDRIWTADLLEKSGWPNCGPCPLCKREQETGIYLFVKCRYTLRL